MQRKRKKPLLFSVIFFILASLLTFGAKDGEAAGQKATHLTILYTTDLYGKLRDFRCKRPGVKGLTYEEATTDFANLLYQVNRIRKEVVQKERRPAPLLFNTGDNLGPELAARFLLEFEGLAGVDFVADVFERFGYDLIGLGNHEFSVAPEKLRDFLMQARLKGLKFSAANIENVPPDHALARYVNRDGAQKTKYFIFHRGGLKIGVFHLMPGELEKQVSQRAVKGVTFGDPSGVASELITKLREELKVDLVIVLSHLEAGKEPGKKIREFARSTEGIDIIITNGMREQGRPLAISSFDSSGKGIYIAGGSKFGNMLGRIDIKVKRIDGQAKVIGFQVHQIPLDESHYNKELRRELKKWELSYCKRWGRPLGQGRIRSKEGMTRKEFMDYTLNLMRRMTRTEVAFINVGAVSKGPFPFKGYVTKDDLYRALPFENKLVVLPISGSDLSSLIDSYWDNNQPDSKKALHFVGVESGSAGTTVNGRSIDSSGVYWVATIEYVAKESSGWINVKKDLIKTVRYTDGVAPELRSMMIEHFGANRFKTLLPYAKPPKPKPPIDPDTGEPKKGVKLPPPKPFSPTDIPFNGNFMELSDKIAWKFSSELEAGLSFITINPINISAFTQQDEFSGGFFQKLQMNGTFKTALNIDTRIHLWKNTFSGAYNGDTSKQFVSSSSGTKINSIFQESEDRIELKSEYRFRYFEAMFPGQSKWYYTSPYAEARIETEISTGGRGFISDKEYFKDETNERFHKFLMEFTAGLSFKITDNLVVRIGATGKQELALNCRRPDPNHPGSVVSCDDPKVKNLPLTVRREFNGGFKIDYELQPWEFARIGQSPISWESRAKVDLTFLIGGNKSGSMIYFASENKLSFALSGNVSVAIGFKFYLHRGLLSENPNDNTSKLVPGPIAVRLEPTFNLRFNWEKRGQTY